MKENEKFEFRIWDPDNDDIVVQFIDVLKAAHGKPLTANKEIFLWKHKANTAGASLLTYAMDKENGKIAAVQVFSPRNVVYNSQIHLAYESNDTSTDPVYARRGLFSALLDLCMSTAEKRKGTFAYGFPNFNSRRGFEKANWSDVSQIRMIGKVCSPFKVGYLRLRKKIEDFAALPKNITRPESTVPKFPEFIDEALEARKQWSGIWTGERNVRLLDWRYLNHPYRNYEIVSTQEGIGILLLGKRGTIKEVKIVDVFFRRHSTDAIKRMIKVIRDGFAPDIITMIITTNHPYFDGFCEAGFMKFPSNIKFFVFPFGHCDSELQTKPWSITGTDIDTQ